MAKKQPQKRNPKGTVNIKVVNGRLRLRLPRQLYGGIQKDFSLNLIDTPENRKLAKAKAKVMEHDIAYERFDLTLKKYQPDYIQDKYPPLLKLWEQFTEAKTKELSKTTIDIDYKKIRNHIKNLPAYYTLSNPKGIRSYLKKHLSINAAKRVFNYINACCEWAVDEELLPVNPFTGIKIKSRQQKNDDIYPFTKVERDMIIKAFSLSRYYKHYLNYVKFLFFTGCRTSEAVGLQRQHIAPDLSIITFSEAVVRGHRKDTKTHKIRRFPVNHQLRAILLDQLSSIPNESPIVFLSPKGNAIDSHNFLTRAWKSILATLPEIEYRPQYNTRHTFITLCLEEGVPVQTVAKWVGNSAQTIYNHYAGLVSNLEVPEL